MAKLLTPVFEPKFKKQYKKLHPTLQKKFIKQLKFLLENSSHPSLQIKKMRGVDLFEARLDYHNRFVYKIVADELRLYAIGPHDEGLGKK